MTFLVLNIAAEDLKQDKLVSRPENTQANKIPTWSSQRWTNSPIGEYVEKNKEKCIQMRLRSQKCYRLKVMALEKLIYYCQQCYQMLINW